MEVVAATSVPAPPEIKEAPAAPLRKTLPASWWSSEKVFELEKRALFAKSWVFTTHTSRFQKAGDYYAFTLVGLNYFLIKTKSGEIKGFHNVCRHRAYPVVRKDKGSSTILGCKYHGWSYNADGALSKAPNFEGVEGFKKEENSLYSIHVHITDQGFIFINFDARPEGPTPFNEWFAGLEEEMHEYDFNDYEYRESFELDGQFNWKTLIDGYQECYHCPTAHPGLNSSFKMETYKVVAKTRYARHYCENKRQEADDAEEEADPDVESSWLGFGKKKQPVVKKQKKESVPGNNDGLWMYLYPNNGLNCYEPAWYSLRVLPITATRSILQYDIYMKKGMDEEKKQEFVKFLKLVQDEDYNLCVNTQKNLNQGVYTTGILHPQKEQGVVYYQGLIKDQIKDHWELEKRNGGPVNPAFIGGAQSEGADELETLCNEIECQGSNPDMGDIQW